ncbi:hypothetical protein [Phascolarctobacterium faecium]|uniref:hypothetical protein n=1 Tax=Phascolarctobacterium faecium TaxID=33025 RepID=UPI002624EBFB|nr:hypothetical protein [uncultured Phascolarctobacterium sp.]
MKKNIMINSFKKNFWMYLSILVYIANILMYGKAYYELGAYMFGYTSVMLGVYGVGHHKDVKIFILGSFMLFFTIVSSLLYIFSLDWNDNSITMLSVILFACLASLTSKEIIDDILKSVKLLDENNA